MTDLVFLVARGLHLGSCLLVLGFWSFDRWVIGGSTSDPEIIQLGKTIRQKALQILWPSVLLSALVWFGVVAIKVSGLPISQALTARVLSTVWRQTNFGTVWQIHLSCGFAGWASERLLLAWPKLSGSRSFVSFLNQVSLAAFVCSLAWAGHGLVGSPSIAPWHTGANALHLLSAGIWPAGLAPLALLLWKARSRPTLLALSGTMINRFSAASLLSVGLITITGLVNSWVLVGTWSNLGHTSYGWLLSGKLIIFAVILGIASRNLAHKNLPFTKTASLRAHQTAEQLWKNVWLEIILATAILFIVALLGMIAPPR